MTQATTNFNSEFLKRIPAAEDWLPKYGRHVSSRVIDMEGKFLVCMRVMGLPFESVNDSVLVSHYDTLTKTISNLGRDHGNKLALWTHFLRRKVRFDQKYQFSSTFAREFTEKYLERFRSNDYFENSFYISLIFKYDDFDDGLKEVEQLGEELYKAMVEYDPEYLETYERNGIMFSHAYSFLGKLWNGYEEEMPVTAAAARELLPSTWMHFGYDAVEIRGDLSSKFAACYDLKDFPGSGWGQLNPLLALPAEFNITQSFTAMTAFESNKAITDQLNKLASVGDKAEHQAKELKLAQGYVSTGELAFGDYHAALVVFGDSAKQAIELGNLVATRSKGECGFVWAKATLSAPFTYAGQMPGAKVKPRPMPKSSRNLASSFSLHDYSSGKSYGNPIGDGSAVAPLQTVSKKLYNFNYHATREEENSTGEKVAGHTLILGSTGVGKTALQLTLATFFLRFDPMMFGIDVGKGMEIFWRQIGGTYLSLEPGVPTGFAPFGMPDTPTNRQHWYDLVEICCQDEDGKLSTQDKLKIKVAVDTVAELDDVRARTFSRLLESIEDEGGDSLFTRLSPWCHATEGRYAYIFDNMPGVLPDISKLTRVAFDVTKFAKEGYEPSEALFTHIFFLKATMKRAGRLLMSIVEEFWLPLKYRITREDIEGTLAAGRKAGEFMVLVSQQPEQAIASPVFPQIRSLTATKIYLPDPEAEWAAYERCNMTPKEFEEFKKLSKSSRKFLIKQGNQSAFATLDLYGFQDEMVVISSTPENILLMEQCIAEYGEDPDAWLEPLQEKVFSVALYQKLVLQYGDDPAVVPAMLERGINERREKKRADKEARAARASLTH
jgi:type IV secretion system protein VirB4